MRAETYNLLTRPRKTADSIQELEERLDRLKGDLYPKGQDQERVQQSRSDVISKYTERVDALANEIDDLRMRYLDELRAAEDLLLIIPDADQRRVLSMRFLDRMGYEAIAEEMHYAIATIYRMRKKAIRQIDSE